VNQAEQFIRIKVLDPMDAPASGVAFGGHDWIGPVSAIGAVIIAAVILAIIIKRRKRGGISRRRIVTIVGAMAAVVGVVGGVIALDHNTVSVSADSTLTLSNTAPDITLMKNRTASVTQKYDITADMVSDNPSGYQLLGKVHYRDQAAAMKNAGISLIVSGGNHPGGDVLDDNNYQMLFDDHNSPTPAGGDKEVFHFTVTIPPTTPAGEYHLDLDWDIVELPPVTPVSFQTFTSTYCANMPLGTVENLADTRNGQKYRIRKMEDGKCWMVDNLKLDNYTETPADSNVTTNYTIPATATSGGSQYDTSQVWDPGNPSDYGGTVNEYNDSLCGPGEANAGTTTCYGYLYNFYAATAGWGTLSVGSGDAPQDVCPKNWRLPTGRDTGEFAILHADMAGVTPPSTDDTLFAGWQPTGAFRGVFSGYYDSGSTGQGYVGAFWSSSVYMVYSASYLTYSLANAYPEKANVKSVGYAVRCVTN
jgi:uncharacterized protein (TIGR02145 family)